MERSTRRPPSIEECYRILGLTASASHREVQSAYRRLALRHHPDIAGDDPSARVEFARTTEAYRTIATLDRLRGRTQRVVGVCHRCGKPEALFLGLDRRRYCSECLLLSRRRFLPLPTYRTIRCVSVMVLQGLGAFWLFRFAGSGQFLDGVAAAASITASLGMLGYLFHIADVIEA